MLFTARNLCKRTEGKQSHRLHHPVGGVARSKSIRLVASGSCGQMQGSACRGCMLPLYPKAANSAFALAVTRCHCCEHCSARGCSVPGSRVLMTNLLMVLTTSTGAPGHALSAARLMRHLLDHFSRTLFPSICPSCLFSPLELAL